VNITSETIDQLATALAAAQSAMENASLNKTNPHFRSRYADLAAIRDATIQTLTKNGLSLAQFTTIDGEGNLLLHTRLCHKSGQWMEGVYPVPVVLDKPQAMGSALTYARRYGWASMCGIAVEEDDDANAAQDAAPKKSAYRARKDGDWQTMQVEMGECKTDKDLEKWGLENADRIYALPDTWQEHLREEYKRRLGLLKGKKGNARSAEPYGKVKQQLKASLEQERAEFADPDHYLDDLDTRMSAAADASTLAEVWQEHVAMAAQLLPPDRDKAEGLLERHRKRVDI
jgi:hypothetical protein